jgi:hypothetical protein
MKRRTLLLATAALPFCARAQSPKAPRRVGVITWSGSLMERAQPGGGDFFVAMKALGYVEGRDVVYEERYWRNQDQAP